MCDPRYTDGTHDCEAFPNFVDDAEGKDIPLRWERLKEQANASILWNTGEALALCCIMPTTSGRMTTELLFTLSV